MLTESIALHSQQEQINHFFTIGMDYESYKDRSETKRQKMLKTEDATRELVKGISDELISYLDVPLKVLCFAENWCGDCANAVPVIAALTDRIPGWELKIVPKDEHLDTFNQIYKTAGKSKIPLIIFADEEGNEITRWVERSTQGYRLMTELLSKHLPRDELITELRDNPEFNPPEVTKHIFNELLVAGEKSAAMWRSIHHK